VDCPDSKVFQNGRFNQFLPHATTRCDDFTGTTAILGIALPTKTNAMAETLGKNATVITKMIVTHPNWASKQTGMLMVKRVVTHLCTGKTSSCIKGTEVADVYKKGLCVTCPDSITVFSSKQTRHMLPSEQQAFFTDCVKIAFEANGELKQSFACETGRGADGAKACFQSF